MKFYRQQLIHLFVAYNVDLGELNLLSYVIISDSLYHDNTAMHLFQNVSLFSRVCAGHNRDEFGISAMWPFQLHHRKITGNGLGGMVK